jgi:hypothetical protein
VSIAELSPSTGLHFGAAVKRSGNTVQKSRQSIVQKVIVYSNYNFILADPV